MTTITIKNKSFEVATEWNELSTLQLFSVCRILYGQNSWNYGCMLLLKVLTGMSTAAWNSLKPSDISEFLYLPADLVNKTRLTRQLVPLQTVCDWIVTSKTFVGPADNFDNLVMSEFVFTEDYFFKFKENEQDIDSLDLLCAVLFRPIKKHYDLDKNPDGDAREPFNQNLCSYYARAIIKKWDPGVKLAILTWYEHCRLNLVEQFRPVFDAGDSTGSPAAYGLLTMMRNVAQAGTYKDLPTVENLYLKMVMIELHEIILDAEQLDKLKPKQTA
jgi:hypothetical protein